MRYDKAPTANAAETGDLPEGSALESLSHRIEVIGSTAEGLADRIERVLGRAFGEVPKSTEKKELRAVGSGMIGAIDGGLCVIEDRLTQASAALSRLDRLV